MAYKDIDEVMAAQQDLVEPLARFEPRLVKMAPRGEPPEDSCAVLARAGGHVRLDAHVPTGKRDEAIALP
jgi:hypothetical protein